MGPVGERAQIVNVGSLDKRYTLSILTCLDDKDEPIFASLRSDVNTQFTFLEFVIAALQRGKLRGGDFLILDNATVHVGSTVLTVLLALLELAGVSLRFLPKYSPELNPCEPFFGYTKDRLRRWRG